MIIIPAGVAHNNSDNELRLRIVNSSIRLSAFSAPFISLLVVFAAIVSGESNLRILVLSVAPLIFPVLFFLKDRLSLEVKGSLFLGLLLLIGCLVLFRGGISIAQAILQMWVLLLAGLIFGVRGVVTALAINLTGFAIAGYAMTSGLAPPISEVMWDPALPYVWIRSGVIMTLFGGSSAVAVAIIVTQLDQKAEQLRNSLAREQEQRLALETVEKDYLQAQNDLADAQRIEALGKMASGVAHDFNNSLTIIMGSAEIAQLDPSNTAQVEKSLKSIVRASGNAAELTRSLLRFGRKDPTKKSIVEIKSFIAALAESLGRLLPADVDLRISDAEPANIFIDKTELEQALFNLVVNSKDAIKGAGEISIGSKCLTLSSNQGDLSSGEYVVISVSDDGTGIKKELKSRVFDPYFSTKKTGSGKGLGLSLLQGLIKDMDGHIQMESEYGQGTTISLFIPIAQPEESTPELPSVNELMQIDTKELSILLVEDNTEVLATTGATLSRAGFRIFQCADGNSAMTAIEQEKNQFDLLCVDGVIPGVSSAQVIESFKTNHPNSPIVICSGYIEEELIIRGIKTGELVYIRKPYRSQELISTIYAALKIG
jgi:signal transduction histidine kinase/ActR/RegA family two-component response regulator